MPFASPKEKIIDILLVPPKEQVDDFLEFLKSHPGCYGPKMPSEFQDLILLKYCVKKGFVTPYSPLDFRAEWGILETED